MFVHRFLFEYIIQNLHTLEVNDEGSPIRPKH